MWLEKDFVAVCLEMHYHLLLLCSRAMSSGAVLSKAWTYEGVSTTSATTSTTGSQCSDDADKLCAVGPRLETTNLC